MGIRFVLVAFAALTVSLAVTSPRGVGAKGGCCYYEVFRLSGGDLPHPVTIPREEVLLSTSGLGSWFEREPATADAPPPGMPYRLEIVGVDIDGEEQVREEQIVFDEQVVFGDEVMMASENGAKWAPAEEGLGRMLRRYVAVGRSGALPEEPTFAQAIEAGMATLGASVALDGTALTDADNARLTELIAGVAAVQFGVQARLVGQRDLSPAAVEVRIGEDALSLSYVPPGIVAPFGLLMIPRTMHSWGITDLIDPPGYWTVAFTVPAQLDEFMATRGFVARTTYDITEARAIPLDAATDYRSGAERVELVVSGRAVASLAPALFDDLCGDCPGSAPAPRQDGEPALQIRVWPFGFDPFPEAVQPAIFDYYAPNEATGRGVLVQTQGAAVANATFGTSAPFYPPPEVDEALAATLATAEDAGKRDWPVTGGVALSLAVTLGAAALFTRRLTR